MSNKIISATTKSQFGSEFIEGDRISAKKVKVQVLSEDDSILYETTRRYRSQNGSGFLLTYSEKVSDLVVKVPRASVLRVFFYIAMHQHHELGGFKISRKRLSEVLRLDAKSIYTAIKWLQDNFLMLESKINGQAEFMVSPDYVTCGSNKKRRMQMWNDRWAIHWKELHAKKR